MCDLWPAVLSSFMSRWRYSPQPSLPRPFCSRFRSCQPSTAVPCFYSWKLLWTRQAGRKKLINRCPSADSMINILLTADWNGKENLFPPPPWSKASASMADWSCFVLSSIVSIFTGKFLSYDFLCFGIFYCVSLRMKHTYMDFNALNERGVIHITHFLWFNTLNFKFAVDF